MVLPIIFCITVYIVRLHCSQTVLHELDLRLLVLAFDGELKSTYDDHNKLLHNFGIPSGVSLINSAQFRYWSVNCPECALFWILHAYVLAARDFLSPETSNYIMTKWSCECIIVTGFKLFSCVRKVYH